MSLKHGGKDPCTSIFPHVIHGFGISQNIPFGYCRTEPDTCPSPHWVHCIHRAKDIRMPHTEADSSISSDENSGNASRVPVRQGFEICIDVRHQFPNHEIFPVTSGRRVDVPRTSEWGIHINRNENKFLDHTRRNGFIKEALGVSAIKIETITILERVRKKIDYRITL